MVPITCSGRFHFQVHRGGKHPLGKTCYKKGSVKTRVKHFFFETYSTNALHLLLKILFQTYQIVSDCNGKITVNFPTYMTKDSFSRKAIAILPFLQPRAVRRVFLSFTENKKHTFYVKL